MAKELDPLKLSSPRIFLFRMLVFVVLGGLVAFLLYKQIEVAFMANPGLNSVIIAVLVIGIVLTFRQVTPALSGDRLGQQFPPRRSGPCGRRAAGAAGADGGDPGSRIGRMAMSAQLMRGILNSIATRLDEARDISRYMTGLLVFLGLLGTFWGLIETVSSVGGVIQGLKAGGDAGSMFDSLREGLAAPLSGMGISFSSSLFGLAGSLVLGFLDLQSSQAQNRFYTELEDWLSTTVYDQAAEPGPAAPAGAKCAARSTAARGHQRDRHQQGRLHRHGESRRGDPGPGAPHAHRTADDPRLGRQPGRAATRDQAAVGNHGARKRSSRLMPAIRAEGLKPVQRVQH